MSFMTSKNLAQRALSLFAVLVLIAGCTLPAAAQRRRTRRTRRHTTATRTATTPPVRYYTLSADQTIRVRMDSELNSRTARIGDRFSTTVTEPVRSDNGVELIPVGSKIWGRVASVHPAGRHSAGTISVSFNQVELPTHARYTINGSLTTLQTDQVNANNESTVKGRSNTKRGARADLLEQPFVGA